MVGQSRVVVASSIGGGGLPRCGGESSLVVVVVSHPCGGEWLQRCVSLVSIAAAIHAALSCLRRPFY